MRAEGSGGRRSDQALMGKGSEDERREGHQSLTALILPWLISPGTFICWAQT